MRCRWAGRWCACVWGRGGDRGRVKIRCRGWHWLVAVVCMCAWMGGRVKIRCR